MIMKHRTSAAVLSLVLTFAGCGGGGGGGGAPTNNPAPILVSVTFLGAGANPVSGDKLRFLISDAAALVAGVELSGTDLTIVGGTIAVTGLPTVISTHVVEVTLPRVPRSSRGLRLFRSVATMTRSPTRPGSSRSRAPREH